MISRGAICNEKAYLCLGIYSGDKFDEVARVLLDNGIYPTEQALTIALESDCSMFTLQRLSRYLPPPGPEILGSVIFSSDPAGVLFMLLKMGIKVDIVSVSNLLQSIINWDNRLETSVLQVIERLESVPLKLVNLAQWLAVPNSCIKMLKKIHKTSQVACVPIPNPNSLESMVDWFYNWNTLTDMCDHKFYERFRTYLVEAGGMSTEILHLAIEIALSDRCLQALVEHGALINHATWVKLKVYKREEALQYQLPPTSSRFIERATQVMHEISSEAIELAQNSDYATTEMLSIAIDLKLSNEVIKILISKGGVMDKACLRKCSQKA